MRPHPDTPQPTDAPADTTGSPGGGGGLPNPLRLAIIAVAGAVVVIGYGVIAFGGVGGPDEHDEHDGHDDGHVGVAVVEAWTAPNPEALAVYLRLDNNLDEDDRLVGATTDMAGTVALMGGGEAGHSADSGRSAAVDLSVPPGSTELLPGESHLMLTDLAADDLAPGDSFELDLTFEETGPVEATVEVVDWDEVVERS
jgi:hypothetical protein